MSKIRKQITVDPKLAEEVERRDEFNLSGFVNRCLEHHFAGGSQTGIDESALRAEIERLEEEIDDVEREKQKLRERRSQLEEKLDELDDEPALMDQAREKLAQTPRDPSNPAIENWASKLGMTSDELVAQLD